MGVIFIMACINATGLYYFFHRHTDMILAWGRFIIFIISFFLGGVLCLTVAPVIYVIFQSEPSKEAPMTKYIIYEAYYRAAWACLILFFPLHGEGLPSKVLLALCFVCSLLAPILLANIPSVIELI